jgi:hypothetical protein
MAPGRVDRACNSVFFHTQAVLNRSDFGSVKRLDLRPARLEPARATTRVAGGTLDTSHQQQRGAHRRVATLARC